MRKTACFLFVVSVLLMTISILVSSKASSSQVLSTVTFEFDGMMGLFMGSSEKVTVGLLDAHHHRMAIYKLTGSEKREVARFKGEQLKKIINISVIGGSGSQRPFQYLAMEGREKDEQAFGISLFP